MANLAPGELLKYPSRVEKFLQKYRDEDPFVMVLGPNVTLDYEPEKEKLIRKITGVTSGKPPRGWLPGKILNGSSVLRNIKFYDHGGREYTFGKFSKTKDEFGGRDPGTSTKIEDEQLKSLITQIEAAKLKQKAPYIKITRKKGSGSIKVVTAQSTPGTPKSDFHLIGENGDAVFWISHKDGSRPTHFLQYGGISPGNEPEQSNENETKKFIEDLRKKLVEENIPGVPGDGMTYVREVENNIIKGRAIYGREYRPGRRRSKQNVDVLLQGPVKLNNRGGVYQLEATNVHWNGDLMTGKWAPYYMARYTGDRNDAGISNTRIGILPKGGRRKQVVI